MSNKDIASKKIKIFLTILRTFDNVEITWSDTFNSHYNIYFKLVDEPFIRGLQLKLLADFKNGYQISRLNKHPENTLITCIDVDCLYGMVFVYKSALHNKTTSYFTPGSRSSNTVFNKLGLPWAVFIPQLKEMLINATIITFETYFKYVDTYFLPLCKSLLQFKQMCCNHHDTLVQKDDDATSDSRLIINGLKVQFFYTSKVIDDEKSHKFTMNHKNRSPYKQGENSLYVFSMENDPLEFLVLPEKILIYHGLIKTDTQKGVIGLQVFHYDYANKGNFTKNKDFWFSADKGYLGNKQFDTINDYCRVIEEDTSLTEKKRVLIPVSQENTNLETGHHAEMYIVDLLNTFDFVESAWKDTNNSKCDVYFLLKGEDTKRGLQVKAITSHSEYGYGMQKINIYPNGMLMVGIHTELNFGVVYNFEEKYNVSSAFMSLNKKSTTIFSELIRHGSNFNTYLEQMISQALIVTDELYLNFIAPSVQLELASHNRFEILCGKAGWSYKRNEDNASVTDVFVNGLKIQMKYVSNHGKGYGSYRAHINRSHNFQPYKKDDNDLYIIEIGERHGEFICIPEKVMIEKGCIAIDEYMPDHQSIQVFPVDYVKNKRESMVNQKYINMIRGNWTTDPIYWFSTESGHMGEEKVKTLEELISLF